MAFTLIAHAGAGGTSGGATTGPVNMTGATFFVGGVSRYANGGSAGTFSDDQFNTWTPLTQIANSDIYVQLFYCVNPTVTSTQLFLYTGAVTFPSVFISGWAGQDVSPFDQEAGALQVGPNVQPGACNPGFANELFITLVGSESGGPVNAIDSGFTILDTVPYTGGSTEPGGMAYKIQTVGSSENPTWDITSFTQGGAVIACFKAAAGGGTTWPGYQSPFGWS